MNWTPEQYQKNPAHINEEVAILLKTEEKAMEVLRDRAKEGGKKGNG